MTSVSTPEDVCNIALAQIGHAERIGSLYEGSRASEVALTIYGQTRDDLLRKQDWGFAEVTASLTLLKTAPPGGYGPWQVWAPATNPPPPWLYEYAYPSDCLMIRSLRAAPP